MNEIKELREQFIGQDDVFWDIAPANDPHHGCYFRETDISGVQCTGYALAIKSKLGSDRVEVFGFMHEDNPGSEIARKAGGHDFAVVDSRFIVDPWIVDVEPFDTHGVFDLMCDGDRESVARLYGDREKWKSWREAKHQIEKTTP